MTGNEKGKVIELPHERMDSYSFFSLAFDMIDTDNSHLQSPPKLLQLN